MTRHFFIHFEGVVRFAENGFMIFFYQKLVDGLPGDFLLNNPEGTPLKEIIAEA